jgi:hypothetical protein
MMKINVSKDCGNSPKNIFIQNLTIAFAKGETGFILESVAEDIVWNIAGGLLIQGKRDFTNVLKGMKNDKTVELNIFHVTSHGKAAAVNGTQKLKSGEILAFCVVYEFTNAKGTVIKEITSYRITSSHGK